MSTLRPTTELQQRAAALEEQLRALREENRVLRTQLEDAEQTLTAIREGQVDALVVNTPEGQRIFTLEGADRPYRELIEQMQEGAVTLMQDGTIRYCNLAFASMLQRPLEAVMGSPFEQYLHAEDRTGFKSLLARCSGGSARGEVSLCAADGRLMPVHLGLTLVSEAVETENTGAGGSICMVVTDLSERRKVQQVLASEQFIRRLIDHAPVGIAVVGRDLRYWLANQAYQGIADGASLAGRSIAEVFPPEVAQMVETAVQQTVDAGQRLTFSEYETPIRGRTWWDVNLIPLQDAAGNVEAVLILTQEVTQRKEAERMVQRASQRYALLSETAGLLLRSTQPQAVVDDLCRSVMRHLQCDVFFNFLLDEPSGRLRLNACAGIPEEEAAKIEWLDLGVAVCGCAARDRQRIIAKDIQNTTDPRAALVRSYGVQAYCAHPLLVGERLLGTLSFGSKSRPGFSADEIELMQAVTDYVAVAVDRTRTEKALAAAKDMAEQASSAKDHFLAVLSHELRTPLTPVLMSVSEHLHSSGLPEVLREDLEMIHRNVELETRLIDDLLDVTRIARGKLTLQPAAADLREIIQRAVETCMAESRGKGLELVVELGSAPLPIVGDATRLQQVFWNLVKNALKFTSAGQVRIGCRVEAGMAIVAVEDDGVGMDADLVGRVFTAFEQGGEGTTRRFGGLGLGLAICRAIVEMHHGTISAASPGKGMGSVFTVTLPLSNAEAARPVVGTTGSEAKRRQSARVLLVEDHEDSARMLTRLLRRSGHNVKHAGDVSTALRTARAEEFDLIISDIGLPDGSGLDLMRQIRLDYPHLRGIALSGHGMESDLQMSRRAGFVAHLVKPVDLSHLERAIAEVLGK